MSLAAFSLFASTLVGLGVIRLGAAWPAKVVDFSDEGNLCSTDVEQYMQVAAFDFHDNPKYTMTWRQFTGACGADEPNPVEWTGSYDLAAGDEPPDEYGWVELSLHVCAPFGEYELELVVESTSAEGSTLLQRTAWRVQDGVSRYAIWDTVDTQLFDDEDYTPAVPGTYVWPFSGSTGYYSTLYAGPLPPIQCPDSIPPGVWAPACIWYEDRGRQPLWQGQLDLPGKENPTGMTLQVCADFCEGYDLFGVQLGYKCFCGRVSDFFYVIPGVDCGSSYANLCTGDSTVACGGFRDTSIYTKTDATPAPTVVTTIDPTLFTTPPSTFPPTPPPADDPTPAPTPSNYAYEGCFVDSKSNRIMGSKTSLRTMSAEICFDLCNDGVNNYFGTQFSNECWCGYDTDLTANGEEAMESECHMDCAGTTTGEKCGGPDRMSAYKISTDRTPTYVGCYGDAKSLRAMPGADKYSSRDTTNELCWDRCSEIGYAYAGTQYGVECWCDDTFDIYGEVDGCDFPCGGDASQICGGFNALSVYEL